MSRVSSMRAGDLVSVNELGGTLQDFYTNRNLTGAATKGNQLMQTLDLKLLMTILRSQYNGFEAMIDAWEQNLPRLIRISGF